MTTDPAADFAAAIRQADEALRIALHARLVPAGVPDSDALLDALVRVRRALAADLHHSHSAEVLSRHVWDQRQALDATIDRLKGLGFFSPAEPSFRYFDFAALMHYERVCVAGSDCVKAHVTKLATTEPGRRLLDFVRSHGFPLPTEPHLGDFACVPAHHVPRDEEHTDQYGRRTTYRIADLAWKLWPWSDGRNIVDLTRRCRQEQDAAEAAAKKRQAEIDEMQRRMRERELAALKEKLEELGLGDAIREGLCLPATP